MNKFKKLIIAMQLVVAVSAHDLEAMSKAGPAAARWLSALGKRVPRNLAPVRGVWTGAAVEEGVATRRLGMKVRGRVAVPGRMGGRLSVVRTPRRLLGAPVRHMAIDAAGDFLAAAEQVAAKKGMKGLFDFYRGRIKELEGNLSAVSSERDEVCEAAEQADADVKSKDSELKETKKKLRKSKKDTTQAKQQLKRVEGDLQQAETNHSDALARAEKVEQELAKAQARVRALQDDIARAQDTLVQVEGMHGDEQMEAARELQDAQVHMQQLETEVGQARDAQRAAQDALKQAEGLHGEAQTQAARELQDAQVHMQQLETEVAQAQDAQRTAQDALKQAEGLHGEAQTQAARELQDVQVHMQQLETEVAQARDAQRAAQDALKQVEGLHGDAQAQAARELQDAQVRMQQLETEVAQARDAQRAAQDALKRVQGLHGDAQAKAAQELQDAQARMQQLETEVDRVKTDRKAARKERAQAQQAAQDAQAEVTRVQADMAALAAVSTDMQEQFANFARILKSGSRTDWITLQEQLRGRANDHAGRSEDKTAEFWNGLADFAQQAEGNQQKTKQLKYMFGAFASVAGGVGAYLWYQKRQAEADRDDTQAAVTAVLPVQQTELDGLRMRFAQGGPEEVRIIREPGDTQFVGTPWQVHAACAVSFPLVLASGLYILRK